MAKHRAENNIILNISEQEPLDLQVTHLDGGLPDWPIRPFFL